MTAKKKSSSKKKPAKQIAKKATTPATKAKSAAKQATSSQEESFSAKTKSIVLSARKRKSTPAIFKVRARKNTPIIFTLDDVVEILKKRKKETESIQEEKLKQASKAKGKPKPVVSLQSSGKRFFEAASVADILGMKPKENIHSSSIEKIPKKFQEHYRSLVEMRDHINSYLETHVKETLKRSVKEDSGDLSSYSQHMADIGTANFDREFALSLVANAQGNLLEIEKAIQRIHEGTYGICEITGAPISQERLSAVPFTRYSLEGQQQLERNKSRKSRNTTGGIFSEISEEDATQFGEEDMED